MTKRIYIAGPMRGIPYFNFPAFDEAKEYLEVVRGWKAISPADLDRQVGFDPSTFSSDYDWTDLNACKFSLLDAIERDLKELQTCDAIYMLKGWQNSKGAKAERAIAEWIGMRVIEQQPMISQPDPEDILEEALRITRGDRQNSYGAPDQDFARTAKIWSALKGVEFEAREVAMFMVALKLSRETHQRKRDNAVDIAGYARCLDICNQRTGTNAEKQNSD